MSHETTRSTSLINQFLLLLMVIMLLYLMASFARQVTVSREQKKELDRLEEQVAAELAEREQLEAALAQAQSDEAMEEWARKNGWGTEGEVIAAPIRDGEMDPQDSQTVRQDATSGDSPKDSWWALFFEAP